MPWSDGTCWNVPQKALNIVHVFTFHLCLKVERLSRKLLESIKRDKHNRVFVRELHSALSALPFVQWVWRNSAVSSQFPCTTYLTWFVDLRFFLGNYQTTFVIVTVRLSYLKQRASCTMYAYRYPVHLFFSVRHVFVVLSLFFCIFVRSAFMMGFAFFVRLLSICLLVCRLCFFDSLLRWSVTLTESLLFVLEKILLCSGSRSFRPWAQGAVSHKSPTTGIRTHL
jgi:hypothetical protein